MKFRDSLRVHLYSADLESDGGSFDIFLKLQTNLSADCCFGTCNTARQDIVGLSTSFFIGGAQSVLATHWS